MLAAGNYPCVAVRDLMHNLFVEHNLCIMKLNPCNDWAGVHLQRVLQPLVARGAVRIVYGGPSVAKVRTLCKTAADD
jgi:hypothetical protein